jgi:hypothetical protein
VGLREKIVSSFLVSKEIVSSFLVSKEIVSSFFVRKPIRCPSVKSNKLGVKVERKIKGVYGRNQHIEFNTVEEYQQIDGLFQRLWKCPIKLLETQRKETKDESKKSPKI